MINEIQNQDIKILFKFIEEQGKKFDEKFKLIDEKFKGIDEKFKGIDEKFKGIDEKFKGIDDKFRGIENTLQIMNTKIDWIHDDNKELRRKQDIIEEELVKPIQRKTTLKYIEFTSIWGFVSFLIAVFASLLSFGIANAFMK